MANLRIGFIGCGGIANGKHFPGMAQQEGVDMCAFCDLILERAEKAAKEYGTPDAKVYTDYKELLADPTIAAVRSSCTLNPNRLAALRDHDRCARGRQARSLREADGCDRGGREEDARGERQNRQDADDRLPVPPFCGEPGREEGRRRRLAGRHLLRRGYIPAPPRRSDVGRFHGTSPSRAAVR